MRIRPQQRRIQLLGLNFLGRNPRVEDPKLLSAQCRGEERRRPKNTLNGEVGNQNAEGRKQTQGVVIKANKRYYGRSKMGFADYGEILRSK